MATVVNFQAANNADWIRGFSLIRAGAGDLPWADVAEWDAETEYTSASVVQHEDNLYVAVGTPTLGAFNAAEWTLVGSAAAFTAEPIDLTGAELTMRLVPIDADGGPDVETPLIALTTADGTIELTSPSQGGARINLPASKARGIAAGTYAYDLIAKNGAETTRLLVGKVVIEQGISR